MKRYFRSPLGSLLLFCAAPLCAGETGQDPPAAPAAPPAATVPEAQFKTRQASLLVLQDSETPPYAAALKLTATVQDNLPKTADPVLSFAGARVVLPAGLPDNKELAAKWVSDWAAKTEARITSTLQTVRAALTLRAGPLPKGWTVEWALENREVIPRPRQAGLGCAVLLNSLITGTPANPGVALAGPVREDRTVAPVHGLIRLLKGVTPGKCEWVCLSRENLPILYADALAHGPAALAETAPIFTVSTLEEAVALTGAELPAPQRRAIAIFEDIRKALPKTNADKWLKHPKVIAKLGEVLAASPDHCAAQVYLLLATGKLPEKPSLPVSVAMIDMLKNEARAARAKTDTAIASATSLLLSIKPCLHPRTTGYFETSVTYCKGLPESAAEYRHNGLTRATSAPESKDSPHALRRAAMEKELTSLLEEPEVFALVRY